MTREQGRWMLWSDRSGVYQPPGEIPDELWRRLRRFESVTSGDGMWREVLDEEGRPLVVLVRHGPPAPMGARRNGDRP